MMALTNEVIRGSNVDDYQRLCNLTSAGLYVNSVMKGRRIDKIAERFFSTTEVFPSTTFPIIREAFQGF